MELLRLAQFLAIKYGFQSEAIALSEDRIISEVKREIINAYNVYFSNTARGSFSGVKGSIFRIFADMGEPILSELVYLIDQLVMDIDKLSPTQIMSQLNNILKVLYGMKNEGSKSIRQNIRDALRNQKEATVKHYLSRYESSLSNVFSLLQKIANKLKILVPEASIQTGDISPQRGELTRQQIVNFVLGTSPFKNFGLDSMEVVEFILDDPEMKEKLTTIINAVNRGRFPKDGPAMQEFATEVKNKLQQKRQTNQSFFDNNLPLSPLESDEEKE